MKLKKALSGILAAAMVVSLTPAMAFATTTASVATAPTVKADAVLTSDIVVTLTVDDKTWDNTAQKFKLTLGNAKWDTNPTMAVSSTAIGYMNGATSVAAVNLSTSTGSAVVGFVAASDNTVEMSVAPVSSFAKDDYFSLTIPAGAVKAGEEDGPITLSIDGLDSKISSKELTVAVVGKSATTATVTGDVKTYARGSVDLKTVIEIRETAVNSIKVGSYNVIELKLPKGVSWDSSSTRVSGDLFKVTSSAISDDGRTLTVPFEGNGSDSVRNVLTIQPSIVIGKDAVQGDITVDINPKSGDASSASDLLIAKYGEGGVVVSTLDEIPTVVSGYLQDNKSKKFFVYATIKETLAGDLTGGKYVDFAFPEEVQIAGPIMVSDTKGKNGTFVQLNDSFVTIGSDDESNTKQATTPSALGSNASTFTFEVPKTATSTGITWKSSANTITFKIPVTVQADFIGDVNLQVNGSKAGIDETEITVAKAISPITVTAETTQVKNGVQSQAVSDITITENEVGYLTKGKAITLSIDNLGLTNGAAFDSYQSVDVTAGNLELGKIAIKKSSNITINIDGESTKASTIEIKGLTVALNRTLPEGSYALQVDGTALIQNGAYDNGEFANDVYAAEVPGYINIVTPAESTTVSEKVDAKFVIGEASYTNNGTATEMDAAAYIDSHNRTMVPIRYVANACGISENDIRWEQNTQTAIINGLNTVVTVKMGSNKLQTSTGEITMDTVAVNNNGRIYVPVRYIANALGANVSWDAATKTVTLTK